MTIATLITHSGPFHPDDLFAYSILSRLHPDANLIRTRDAATLAGAGPETILFDVGDVHDLARGRFDHHQPDRPLRQDGVPFSSFGLIWQAFGHAWLAEVFPEDGDLHDAIHAQIDRDFVRHIDATDNGHLGEDQDALMHPMALPSILLSLAPDCDRLDRDEEDAAFRDAAEVTGTILFSIARRAQGALRNARTIEAALAGRPDPRWVELPRAMPYLATVLDLGADELLYVVYPAKNEWIISSVNVSPKNFILRKRLPEAWAGLRGEDLKAASGVADARFCHTAGFVAVAESRDGAMALLERALAA